MTTITTDKLPPAIGPYSIAKLSNGFLFTSGQIGTDPLTGKIVGPDISSQVKQVMKNIQIILETAGTSFDRVVKTTCFLTNMENFSQFNDIYSQYFTKKPARSCFAVSRLPLGALVEVELIAEV